ncbi:hypothetical protein [Marmoricola sp. RAF53]|uniref:hypothetical protein n=1 Tax=Marmoricola sp. RAF53 TaxID=3233059 RepID=UPI003F9E4CF6
MTESLPPVRPPAGFLVAVRGRWLIAVAGLLAGLVAGVGWAAYTSPSYRAATLVQLGSGLVDGTTAPAPADGPSAALVATSGPVVARVARRLDLPAAAVTERLAVVNPTGTDLLRVTFTGPSAKAAAAGAAAVADAVLEQRRLGPAADQDAEVARLTDLLARTRAMAHGAPKPARASTDQVLDLEQQLRSVQGARLDPGRVVALPEPPSRTGVPPAAGVVAASLAGLLLGCVLAYLLECGAPRVQRGAEPGRKRR